ncbi:aldehyde dehydrogenase [Roseofilum casamattae]|uniref:Aldehyde dehydrogenase n=1 Tax=Roseofilum casamattae BLCC-M143 TaxID=3022442 RepID=A0ABT7BTC9_9CYAN|nr:aldehyde dehydrogenase [Roseofilum casamattae]MDJ1181761.1 aldehyde dehydrogenase [Roseofilum casamattae BLCC-M143]
MKNHEKKRSQNLLEKEERHGANNAIVILDKSMGDRSSSAAFSVFMNQQAHNPQEISQTIIAAQRSFFASRRSQDITFRRTQLQKLRGAITENKSRILTALRADLSKPELEGYYEFSPISEIDYALKHLRTWMKPRRVMPPLVSLPSQAEIRPEPLGVVLIISAWNYPFSLAICPLVNAIAAGNCAIVKPSEFAPHTSAMLAELIEETFPKDYITVIEGDGSTSQSLLAEKLDLIFFTGSGRVGKLVLEQAAKTLTPVVLELGGKSPCIVDKNCDLKTTARRIIWGKFLNAGQTCIAPDYVLVDRQIQPELTQQLLQEVKTFYGEDPEQSSDYARIVNEKHFNSLIPLLEEGEILCGGQSNRETYYIAPTLMAGVTWESRIMQQEIFGPILPILDYGDIEEAIAQINRHPKPLALYLFSTDARVQHQVLQNTSSGSVVLNDTMMQVNMPQLPFGGVGDSGMGNYHGKAGFDTFSHYKSILKRPFQFDINLRYPPYGNKLNLLKRILGY